MSSRKNTPEKQMQEDFEREVNKRVQKEMVHLLNNISISRQVAEARKILQQIPQQEETLNQVNKEQTLHKSIPDVGRSVHNLIGDVQ